MLPHLKRIYKLRKRKKFANSDAYFDWSSFFSSQQPVKNYKKKILVASSTGGLFNAVSLEGLVAAALQIRGVKVEALLCDKALSACQECQILWYPSLSKFINKGPQHDLCKNCFLKDEYYSNIFTINERLDLRNNLFKELENDDDYKLKIFKVVEEKVLYHCKSSNNKYIKRDKINIGDWVNNTHAGNNYYYNIFDMVVENMLYKINDLKKKSITDKSKILDELKKQNITYI